MDYGQLQTALVLSPLVPIYREVSASLRLELYTVCRFTSLDKKDRNLHLIILYSKPYLCFCALSRKPDTTHHTHISLIL